MSNSNSSLTGCLIQLVAYAIIISIVYFYYTNKENNEFKKNVDEFTKYFNYSVDSLKNNINQYYSNSDESDVTPLDNNIKIKGKAIVFFKNDDVIKFDVSTTKALGEPYIAKKIEELNTIVVTISGEKKVGEYTSSVSAIQRYEVIYFLDAKTKEIKKRVVVYGNLPPQKTRQRRSVTKIEGSYPSIEEIGQTIRSNINLQ